MNDEPQGAAAAPKAEVQAFALVRDHTGKPRIEGDPRQLHPAILWCMTGQEIAVAAAEWELQQANARGDKQGGLAWSALLDQMAEQMEAPNG